MAISTVLTNRFASGRAFRDSFSAYCREHADLAERTSNSLTTKTKARTLRRLAEHVQSLDPSDQRLVALHVAQRYVTPAGENSHLFQPVPRGNVARVIAYASQDLSAPAPDDLVHEIVRYAVEDVAKAEAQRHAERMEAHRAEVQQQAKEWGDQYVRKSQLAQEEASARAAQLDAVNADLAAELEHLRLIVKEGQKPEDQSHTSKAPKGRKKAGAAR